MTKLTQALNRIEQINWNNTQENKPSYTILINEFLSRGNTFRDIYERENTTRLAVFSAAQIINASIPEDIHAIIDNKDLVKHGWTMASLCQYYLEWSYLIDMKNEVAIEYRDLYEPIIKLFERGGKISYHQNELICGRVVWPFFTLSAVQ